MHSLAATVSGDFPLGVTAWYPVFSMEVISVQLLLTTCNSSEFACGNGDGTILHPTTYDICDACYVRYCVEGQGDEGLAQERR